MGPTPLVTIAMPVFNGGVSLRDAVSSIVGQTFADWELLLIDDGSTDGAVSSLPDIIDVRIRVLSDGMNEGLAARLNQAISLARGRYFARMDHDDVAHPHRLEHQVRYLEANSETDLLGTKCIAVSERDEILGELPFHENHVDICHRPWLGFYLPHPTWMGRTEWFRRHRYAQPAPFRCEDQELLLRAHAVSTYHALDETLLAYRIRDNVNVKTLFRTRIALAREQTHYFWSKRDLLGMACAIAAMAARIAKDLLEPSTGRRSEATEQSRPSDLLWWQSWLEQMSKRKLTP